MRAPETGTGGAMSRAPAAAMHPWCVRLLHAACKPLCCLLRRMVAFCAAEQLSTLQTHGSSSVSTDFNVHCMLKVYQRLIKRSLESRFSSHWTPCDIDKVCPSGEPEIEMPVVPKIRLPHDVSGCCHRFSLFCFCVQMMSGLSGYKSAACI